MIIKVYGYDAEGLFTGETEAQKSPLDGTTLMPSNTTTIAPKLIEGLFPVWYDNTWVQKKDIRGTECWDAEGKPTVIMELGELPEGYSLEAPEPTQEELDATRKVEIYARLDAIDTSSIRPLRAISSGTSTQYDIDKLVELDAETVTLRQELSSLSS